MFSRLKKHRVLVRELLPFTFLLAVWIVKLVESFCQDSYVSRGVLPREPRGLGGILTMPFIHADWGHLLSNSLPLLVLGYLLFRFYREIVARVFVLLIVSGGFLTWAFARPGVYHIGASGVVYGLAAFLVASGAIRRHPPLMVVSLIVVYLYGSMVWYMFPVEEGISWEGHLSGALSGLVLAFVFRRHGPQRKRYDWEDEKEEPENTSLADDPYRQLRDKEREAAAGEKTGEEAETPSFSPGPGIHYFYKK